MWPLLTAGRVVLIITVSCRFSLSSFSFGFFDAALVFFRGLRRRFVSKLGLIPSDNRRSFSSFHIDPQASSQPDFIEALRAKTNRRIEEEEDGPQDEIRVLQRIRESCTRPRSYVEPEASYLGDPESLDILVRTFQ